MVLRTYFDVLSEEVLDNLVRHLSEKPSSRNWTSFMNAEVARLILSNRGRLGSSAKRLFRCVSVTKAAQHEESNPFIHPILSHNALLLSSRSYGSTILAVLQNNGNIFEEFSICFSSTRVPYSKHWLLTIGTHCVNLRVLRVLERVETDTFRTLVGALGPRLEILSAWLFASDSHLEVIAQHCPSLIELELAGLRGNCRDLWRTLSRTLRRLQVTFRRPTDVTQTVRDIGDFCRNLSHLKIYGAQNNVEDTVLADIYSSYGVQLEYANVRELDPNACAKVVASCPRVRCIASHRTEATAQMLALGASIEELHFHAIPPRKQDELRDAALSCLNVKKMVGIELTMWDASLFRSLFSNARPALKTLQWSSSWPCIQNEDFFFDIIRIIAMRTGNLIEFSISADVARAGLFRDLARLNPALQVVNISFLSTDRKNISEEQAEFILLDCLLSFKACKHLKELRFVLEGGVWNSEIFRSHLRSFQNESVFFRNRRVVVQVGSVLYAT